MTSVTASIKTQVRFVHDFKVFAKDEKVAKINLAIAEMANTYNLVMDEDVHLGSPRGET